MSMKPHYVREYLDSSKAQQEELVKWYLLTEVTTKLEKGDLDDYNSYYYSRAYEYLNKITKKEGI